jgi:hypothetical protein
MQLNRQPAAAEKTLYIRVRSKEDEDDEETMQQPTNGSAPRGAAARVIMVLQRTQLY